MKIVWNKVTWYSKLIAVALIVVTFFYGFYLGSVYGASTAGAITVSSHSIAR